MNEESESAGKTAETGKSGNSATDSPVTFRLPEIRDGQHIWQLVKDTGVLDLNSVYCYLLLCDHFRHTCGVAELDGKIVGFVTAYLLPADETTLFVWQVGTDAAVRGRGIAKKLVLDLLERETCKKVTKIECTISPSNKASLALFNSLAKHLQTDFSSKDYYGTSLFPDHGHEQEDQIIVGPFKQVSR